MNNEMSVSNASETAGLKPSHIVGIGASAGGLSALEQFFDNMPVDTGMAFVVIQHLSPDFKSLMDDLLSRHTKMPIHRVTNGIKLQPDSIYLIPPKTHMTISKEHLYLTDKTVNPHSELPIDIFFNTLAEDVLDRAIGVVLSGTGSDGSKGIVTINRNGGLVIIQSPESAQFDGMPRNAIATGVCDFILAPDRIPRILVEYAISPLVVRTRMNHELEVFEDEGEFASIFALLRRHYKLDFSKYKGSTVGRRIRRRMEFRQIPEVSDYVAIVSGDQGELELLYKDLLIGVTEFFRDKQAFQFLEQEIIPRMFANLDSGENLRIWSAACATGEEAYSLAILLAEKAEEIDFAGKITVFATDVHKTSLEFASQGLYDRAKLTNVSPERIDKFFKKEGSDEFRVSSELRKLVVFAPHNLLSDPPFTRLDLVCCRNLLIYFQTDVQEKVISLFHFALKKESILFLGSSEGLGAFSGEFEVIANHHKMFRKIRDLKLALNLDANRLERVHTNIPVTVFQPSSSRTVSIDRQVLSDYDTLLRRHIPPGVLIDENRHIVHYFGNVAEYLKMPEGRAENNILALVEDHLHIALSTSLQRADSTRQFVVTRNVRIKKGESEFLIDLNVAPLPDEKSHSTHYHVYFERVRPQESPHLPDASKDTHTQSFDAENHFRQHVADLEMELQSTRENLQTTVEELQTSNEELQATNEELLASNEELQSTNEELHSVNEELYSVNSEFERKNIELKQLNNDHENLLSSTDIGTVFLDRQLRIRKYNPAIASFFKLIPQDIGRPIDHIAYHLSQQEEMLADIHRVLTNGVPIEKEECTRDNTWHLNKIMPFRTETGQLEGVVITFTDITSIKAAELKVLRLNEELEQRVEERTLELKQEIRERMKAEGLVGEARDHYLNILAKAPALIWRANTDAQCNWFNTTWLDFTGRTMEQEYGNGWVESVHTEDYDQCVAFWQDAFKKRESFELEFRMRRHDGEYRWINNIGCPMDSMDGSFAGYIGYCFDITERKRVEMDLSRNQSELRAIYDHAPVMMCVVDTKRHIQYANSAFATFTGVSENDFQRGDACGMFCCINSLEDPRGCGFGKECGKCSLLQAMEDTFKTGTEYHNIEYTTFLVGHDAPREVTLLASTALIRSENQTRLLLCLHDNTERKRAELENKRLEQHFYQAQKLESLGVLAGGVAHDFNNILTVILGQCYVVRKVCRSDQDLNNSIQQIETAANRAADLCRQMLTYAGRRPLVQTRTNLWVLVDQVVKMLQSTIQKNVIFDLDLNQDVPEILGDSGQIQQIAMNLIINSAEAIGNARGTIRVTLTEKMYKESHLGTDVFGTLILAGRYACLEVTDTGIGMDEETRKRIFEPFFTTKFTGRGLGMSAINSIITSHRGLLLLKSEPGLGTTFKVCFPVPDAFEIFSDVSDPLPQSVDASGTILLVDDEESLRNMGTLLLEALGFTAMTAQHGREAVDIYRELGSEIDVILMDLIMPEMGGIEAYHELRKIDLTIPIVISSGYGVESIADVIDNDTHAAFVHKPYHPNELRNVMIQMMSQAV